MKFGIGLTISAMVGLFLLALGSAQVMEYTGHARPNQVQQCPIVNSLTICAPPAIQTLEVPDSQQAEWTYCGNANGPCTVNAYIDGRWVIVKLVRR